MSAGKDKCINASSLGSASSLSPASGFSPTSGLSLSYLDLFHVMSVRLLGSDFDLACVCPPKSTMNTNQPAFSLVNIIH